MRVQCLIFNAHECSLHVSQLAHLLLQYNNPTGFQAGHTWDMCMPIWHASPTCIGMHQDVACCWPPEAPPAASPACSPTVCACLHQLAPYKHMPGSTRTQPAAGHLRLPLWPHPPIPPWYAHARTSLTHIGMHQVAPGRGLPLAT